MGFQRIGTLNRTISHETFEFSVHNKDLDPQVGGFDWRMAYVWNSISPEKRKNRNHVTDPLETPTMAGGLFAIDRDYFYEIGSYDTGMDIWVRF